MQRFSFLWQLLGQVAPSKPLLRQPLLLTMDALDDPDTHVLMESRSWAKGSVKLLDRVVDPVLHSLMDLLDKNEQARNSGVGLPALDHSRIVYLLGRLTALVRCDPVHFMQCANGFPTSALMEEAIRAHLQDGLSDNPKLPTNNFLRTAGLDDYVDALLVLAIHTLAIGTSWYVIGVAAAELAAALINALGSSMLSPARLVQTCTSMLSPIIGLIELSSQANEAEAEQDPLMQVQLLGLLVVLMRHAEPAWAESAAPLLQSLAALVKHGLHRDRPPLARSYWIWFVRVSLPCLGGATAQIASTAQQQLCALIRDGCTASNQAGILSHHFAAELEQLLEGVAAIVSECTTQGDASAASMSLASPQGGSIGAVTGMFADLMQNMFTQPEGADAESLQRQSTNIAARQAASAAVFQLLPTLIEAIVTAWALRSHQPKPQSDPQSSLSCTNACLDTETVYAPHSTSRRAIQELLEPLISRRPHELLSAIIVTWMEGGALQQAQEQRRTLMELLTAIEPPNSGLVIGVLSDLFVWVTSDPDKQLERMAEMQLCAGLTSVGVLHLLQIYIQACSLDREQLAKAWTPLLLLIKHGVTHCNSPNSVVPVMLLRILDKYTKRSPLLADKKQRKELQDTTTAVLTSVIKIASSTAGNTSAMLELDSEQLRVLVGCAEERVAPDLAGQCRLSGQAAPDVPLLALDAISSILAVLIFRIWDDRDKDKVVAFLGLVVPQLLPVLKPTSAERVPHAIKALSTLVALAEYTDIAKSWRKLLWDSFLDPGFFNLDVHTLRLWGVLVDSLLMRPHEGPQALHELIHTKVSGMFSSKEAEIQNRARLLKRLAFALFSGPYDSYSQHAPFIFEKLVESLRMGSRQLVAQVFLVMRVLLLRVSPAHTTSMWSVMMPEITRVLQSPSTDLNLTLAAFKLLDLVLVLNHDGFSCFRWVFLGGGDHANDTHSSFRPLILHCIPDNTDALSEDMPLPNQLLCATRRRPVILLQTVSGTNQLSGYAQLLLTIAADPDVKTLPVDTQFVEVMLELEMIDSVVNVQELVSSLDVGVAPKDSLCVIADDWIPLSA